MSAPSIDQDRIRSRVLLVPAILTNPAGMHTAEARVLACRELQAPGSPKRTRHLEISLPPGVAYRAGDHLGVCPKNDEERVERLARHLGATLDGLFMAPKTMNVRAVPKGLVLQVRNVLTNLIDITGRPTVRPAGGSGAVQRHPLEPPGLYLPRRDRAVRGRRGAQPRSRRDLP